MACTPAWEPHTLLSVSNDIQTDVEDIALTLLFAEKGIQIEQLSSIRVDDPKPTEMASASRQRARWFRGQWAAFWHYRIAICRIIGQGPRGLSLISGIFLKPRWLSMVINLLLACLCLRLPGLAAFWGLLFCSDAILVSIGILSSADRSTFVRAFLYLPGFILMWLKSIRLAFYRLPWLRVREVVYPLDQPAFKPAGHLEPEKR
jgi:hypothetical protein